MHHVAAAGQGGAQPRWPIRTGPRTPCQHRLHAEPSEFLVIRSSWEHGDVLPRPNEPPRAARQLGQGARCAGLTPVPRAVTPSALRVLVNGAAVGEALDDKDKLVVSHWQAVCSCTPAPIQSGSQRRQPAELGLALTTPAFCEPQLRSRQVHQLRGLHHPMTRPFTWHDQWALTQGHPPIVQVHHKSLLALHAEHEVTMQPKSTHG